MHPLPNANQGDLDITDEIKLVGVTRSPLNITEENPTDELQMFINPGADLVFLQVDPSEYLARQRFMSHKCALGKVEDYRLDGITLIDPHKPITWEETVINLFVMDMLVNNSLPNKTTYKNGLYAYSYPFLQDNPNVRNEVTPLFVNSISDYVLGGRRTDYPLIDKFLYSSLMARQKVMLGGMP